MPAVPGEIHYVATVQDAHGDVAVVKFPAADLDISTEANALSVYYGRTEALLTALAACMNVKIVKHGVNFSWSRAQKPAGPLSTYAHVYQQAFLNFGDGGLERARITIPGPKTSDLMTDGITVNPADANVAPLITAIEANCTGTSGNALNEYLGGRFREGKPRRRTNLYNATA